MTHEYDDAVTSEKIDMAVRRTLGLLGEKPEGGIVAVAAFAVEETFCLCVTGAEDAAECKTSEIHRALVGEVVRRVRRSRSEAVPEQAADPVELASEQSFPASDSPAWVWHR